VRAFPPGPVGADPRGVRKTLLTTALIALLAVPGTAGASVRPQSADLETGTLAQFDQRNAVVGTLATVPGGYGDSYAARATYSGGGSNGYSRGIFNVGWSEGEDVWYSAAYYLPVGFKAAMQGQVALLRWDDYGAHPNDADQGGIVINGGDKRSRLVLNRLAQGTQTELTSVFDLPEGRWFHLEVHQRLSSSGGAAVNEVFLDGIRVASSDRANLEAGRGVDRMRYGIVAIASGSQTRPLELLFDKATVNTARTGPDGDLVAPVEPPQPPPTSTGSTGSTGTTSSTGSTAPPAVVQPPPSPVTANPSGTTSTPPQPTSEPKRHRYTRKVRKCVNRAMKRISRKGNARRLPRAVRRCVARYGR
jgi:hypothetical protein